MKNPRFISALLILYVIAMPVSHGAAGIASAHPLATKAGQEILAKGGNAFDAAVAITAALAVVEPAGSGLGGGGFWLMHHGATGEEMMVDGREKAPKAASRDMYLDASGEVVPGLSVDGPLAAGIPGEPAAMAWIAERYGNLPLGASLEPAIRYAEQGFAVGKHYQRLMKFREPVIASSPAAAAVFLDQGEVPEPGWKLVQKDLGNTLRQIAEHGHQGFYQGEVAEKLVAGTREAGGIWTLEDLEDYQIKVRKPVKISYKGTAITSAALPSSGGLVMAIALNILEQFDLSEVDEIDNIHLLVEAMRRAYRDRAEWMGDPDFVAVPAYHLVAKSYARTLSQGIDLTRATPSDSLPSAFAGHGQGSDTTHFSVVDDEGNRVAATLSINYPFGSGFVPEGTGVLLNDEMDDFSAKPGEPNVYGLVGAEANAILPEKRMLSSMSPTFIESDDRVAVIGTPGGSRIISMVLQGLLAFEQGASAEEIVARGRIHHQYLPDHILYEPGALTPDQIARLELKGHQLKPRDRTWGNMHTVIVDKRSGQVSAASDPRGEGIAIVID